MRLINNNDITFYQQLYTCPDVMRYMGGPMTAEQVTHRFDILLQKQGNKRVLQYVISERTQSVGILTFSWSKTRPGVEWGIMISPTFQGQGVASDALLASIAFAKHSLQLNSLLTQTDKHNLVTIGFLQSLFEHQALDTLSLDDNHPHILKHHIGWHINLL
ncbi:N-acetyltransferase [Thalassotalea sp. HSM 43]|uniref:GNAT family N-acetyltransferase n=1 Tax=Thalassotalea sp. HSM 43 TaxID=2552945 RepID=UPI0010807C04|nr:GNAT family N-acetyltransferase [Thalassotalea sp. HSM 43]QBY03589.1 N-acetyltransferase [Thalassotalea sp. HSM 43]